MSRISTIHIDHQCARNRRELVLTHDPGYERNIYVLHHDAGCVTYERDVVGASINLHQRADSRSCYWCDGTGIDDGERCDFCVGGEVHGEPCHFLGGERCLMEGTSLAPVLYDEDDIWTLLKHYSNDPQPT